MRVVREVAAAARRVPVQVPDGGPGGVCGRKREGGRHLAPAPRSGRPPQRADPGTRRGGFARPGLLCVRPLAVGEGGRDRPFRRMEAARREPAAPPILGCVSRRGDAEDALADPGEAGRRGRIAPVAAGVRAVRTRGGGFREEQRFRGRGGRCSRVARRRAGPVANRRARGKGRAERRAAWTRRRGHACTRRRRLPGSSRSREGGTDGRLQRVLVGEAAHGRRRQRGSGRSSASRPRRAIPPAERRCDPGGGLRRRGLANARGRATGRARADRHGPGGDRRDSPGSARGGQDTGGAIASISSPRRTALPCPPPRLVRLAGAADRWDASAPTFERTWPSDSSGRWRHREPPLAGVGPGRQCRMDAMERGAQLGMARSRRGRRGVAPWEQLRAGRRACTGSAGYASRRRTASAAHSAGAGRRRDRRRVAGSLPRKPCRRRARPRSDGARRIPAATAGGWESGAESRAACRDGGPFVRAPGLRRRDRRGCGRRRRRRGRGRLCRLPRRRQGSGAGRAKGRPRSAATACGREERGRAGSVEKRRCGWSRGLPAGRPLRGRAPIGVRADPFRRGHADHAGGEHAHRVARGPAYTGSRVDGDTTIRGWSQAQLRLGWRGATAKDVETRRRSAGAGAVQRHASSGRPGRASIEPATGPAGHGQTRTRAAAGHRNGCSRWKGIRVAAGTSVNGCERAAGGRARGGGRAHRRRAGRREER